VLRSLGATGLVAVAAPWIVRSPSAAAGTLRWLAWEDSAPQPLLDRFTKDTGIAVEAATFSTNEELLARLEMAKGEGFDLCSPTVQWVPAHVEKDLLQPIDEAKVPNLKNLYAPILENTAGFGAVVRGKRYACPYDWGTEGLGYDTRAVTLEHGKASFGDLWDERYQGRVVCRPRSVMLGTGLWMERTGELPEGAMRKAYDDEAAFDLAYGKASHYVIASRPQIGAFWSGTEDTQKAFLEAHCVIGQTWDGPMFQLRNDGQPYAYVAPVEGALAWVDGLALPAAAVNIEQAYAFINWSFQPEIGGMFSDSTGYNSVVAGFDDFVQDSFKQNFRDAYPGDAVGRLWIQGVEQPWFIEKRQALADKITSA
jgi:spermidine/putrescine transport system substrate-binding protein